MLPRARSFPARFLPESAFGEEASADYEDLPSYRAARNSYGASLQRFARRLKDVRMRPMKTKVKKFRQETKYPHNRSEGLTWRRNSGSVLQEPKKRTEKTINA